MQAAVSQLTELLENQSRLKKRLEREQTDVDELDGMTLTNLFATVFNTKDERLRKEKEELVAAKLNYDEVCEAVADGQREVDRLNALMEESNDAEDQYKRLLDEKASILEASESASFQKLSELTGRIADLAAGRDDLMHGIYCFEKAQKLMARRQSLQAAADRFRKQEITQEITHDLLNLLDSNFDSYNGGDDAAKAQNAAQSFGAKASLVFADGQLAIETFNEGPSSASEKVPVPRDINASVKIGQVLVQYRHRLDKIIADHKSAINERCEVLDSA